MNRRIAIAVLLAAVLAGPAAAAEKVLTLEPEATRIAFDLPATGHDVHGEFRLRHGDVRFDPATGEASGEIAVDAVGAETGSKKRDQTMHGKVLESEDYPLFVLRVQRVEGELPESGEAEIEIRGILAMHGGEHEVVWPSRVSVDGERISATVRFAVPFVDWGLHDPSMLFLRVSKEVEVFVEARGLLRDEMVVAGGGSAEKGPSDE